MNDIEKLHISEYGIAPDTVIEVPQPVTLLGAFSGYVSGYSLMCTIPDGITIAVSFRDDNSVRISNNTKQDKKKFALNSIKYRREDKWANAVKAVVQTFQNGGYKIRGMNITISGASLSAGEYMNAMLLAGIAKALSCLYNPELSDSSLLDCCMSSSSFSPSCNVHEKELVTIFESREGSLLFFDFDKGSHQLLDISCMAASGYILDSAIPSSVLMPILAEFKEDIVPVFASLRQAFPRNRKLLSLTDKELRMYSGKLPEIERHYIEYVLEESRLAKKGFEMLSAGDTSGFGHLLSLQQRNLMNKAELTSPESDWLIRRAQEIPAVLGAAQIYLGKPGVMLILIESDSEVEYTSRLEEYDRIFGFHAVLKRFTPSGSIRKLS